MRLSSLFALSSALLMAACGSDNNNNFSSFNNPFGFSGTGGCAQVGQPINFSGPALVQRDYYSTFLRIFMGQGVGGTQGYTPTTTTTTTTPAPNYSGVIVSNGTFNATTSPLQNRYGSITVNNTSVLYQNFNNAPQSLTGSMLLSQYTVSAIGGQNYGGYPNPYQGGYPSPYNQTGTTPSSNILCVQTMDVQMIISNGLILDAAVNLHMSNGQQIPISFSPNAY